jgi:hypothetical protein
MFSSAVPKHGKPVETEIRSWSVSIRRFGCRIDCRRRSFGARDKLARAADAWRTAAESMRVIGTRLKAAVDRVDVGQSPEIGPAIVVAFREMSGSLGRLAEAARHRRRGVRVFHAGGAGGRRPRSRCLACGPGGVADRGHSRQPAGSSAYRRGRRLCLPGRSASAVRSR